jgi:tetratricopeptide (TPR) repeat protein
LVALGLICAVRFRPERDPDWLWSSVQADLHAQRFERAYAAMRRLVDLRRPTQEDRLVLAQLAMTTGRTDEALDNLAQVPDFHPMSSQARLWEGQLALRRQRAHAAELSFLRALTIDPGLIPARRALVYLYGMQRRRRELATQFEALAELAPMTFDEVILWCLIRVSPWDPNEVRPILEGFLQADPSDRSSRLALADVYRRLGLAEDVDVALRQLPPVDPDARAIRARMAYEQGDAQAVEPLLAPDHDGNPILEVFRGRIALVRGDLPSAVRHFRDASAADPHDPTKIFMLGEALIKAGDTSEGRIHLKSAEHHKILYELIERASEGSGRHNLSLLREIGAAYERVGLVAEAKAWYKLALAQDPTDSGVQAALYNLAAATAQVRMRPTIERLSASDAKLASVHSDCPDARPSTGRYLAPPKLKDPR